MLDCAGRKRGLQSYLDDVIFRNMKAETLAPDAADIAGFETFMERFKKGLGI